MAQRQKNGNGTGAKGAGWALSVPLSGLISLSAGFLLSLPASLLLYAADDPGTLIRPAALLFGMLCHMICGFCFRRMSGLSTLLSGFISGVLLFVIFFGCSLLLPAAEETKTVSTAFAWAMRCVGILFSLFGSVLAANAPGRRRKKRHRSHRRSVHA